MTRQAFVDSARAALAAVPRFGGWTALNIWAKSINAASLPMIGVGSPGGSIARDGLETTERVAQIYVVIKRSGADLENHADADEAAVEIAVMSVLDSCDLTQVSYAEDTTGQEPVSTLTLQFSVTYWLDDPLA
jgi:hypothetical protein